MFPSNKLWPNLPAISLWTTCCVSASKDRKHKGLLELARTCWSQMHEAPSQPCSGKTLAFIAFRIPKKQHNHQLPFLQKRRPDVPHSDAQCGWPCVAQMMQEPTPVGDQRLFQNLWQYRRQPVTPYFSHGPTLVAKMCFIGMYWP